MINFSLNIIICFITLLTLNFILSKYTFLIDNPETSHHKIKHNNTIALSGGLYLLISYSIISYIYDLNIKVIFYFFPLFIIGVIADSKKNFSPSIRLILQILIIICIVFFLNIKISSIGIDAFDSFLKNNIFNIFFSVFCLVTVLNGFNFIDGINGFASGKIFLILSTIYLIVINNDNIINENFKLSLEILISIIFTFFILNILGKCFLGDNGIYIFSIITSIYVINIVELSETFISPMLGLSLLWYPAFENLFTIIRRLMRDKKISDPDKYHLHTLLKNFIGKNIKLKLNQTLINSLSGITINLLLLPNYIFSFIWFNKSLKLGILATFYIIIYIILYVFLINQHKK